MKSMFGSSSVNDSRLTDASVLEEVDAAMRSMDYTYNTQFYNWIHNENNVDYIAYYMRKIIADYEEAHPRSVYRAIKWLVTEWSIQRTAELLVKLFYHWGIDCPKFAHLVTQVVDEWDIKQTIELVVTLVIGERSSKVAQFINQLTASWSTVLKVELVKSIGIRLRWNERYFKHFLFHYATMHHADTSSSIISPPLRSHNDYSTRMTINHIRQRFQARRIILQQQHYVPTSTESMDSNFSLVEFSTAIFEKIVSRSLHTLEIPLGRPDPASTGNFRSKNPKYPYHYRHLMRLPFYSDLDKCEQPAGSHTRSLVENPIRSDGYMVGVRQESGQYSYSHCYSGASTSSSPSPSATCPSPSLLEKLTHTQPGITEPRLSAFVFDEGDQNST